ncbi:uncharacterized protein LOC141907469 [Tubulanus polymorphus]|uniref:uncharacterized protein LOC141907469 n=1 Tax=Tubulanus polymorphus TaxID=672921 RepID=UPI003DA2E6C8
MLLRRDQWIGFIILLISCTIGLCNDDANGGKFHGAYQTLCRVCRNAKSFEDCEKTGSYITCPENKTTCMTDIHVKASGKFIINRRCVRKKYCHRKRKTSDTECSSGYVRKQCRFCCQGYDCDRSVPKIRLPKDCAAWGNWTRCDNACKGRKRRKRDCTKYEITPDGNMIHFTPVRPKLLLNDTFNFISDSYIMTKKKLERQSERCWHPLVCNGTEANAPKATEESKNSQVKDDTQKAVNETSVLTDKSENCLTLKGKSLTDGGTNVNDNSTYSTLCTGEVTENRKSNCCILLGSNLVFKGLFVIWTVVYILL